jgi:hypothetical protein
MNGPSKSLEHIPLSGAMWVKRPAAGVHCNTVCWSHWISTTFYGILSCSTALGTALHWSVSNGTWFQSMSYILTFILILSSHVCQLLPTKQQLLRQKCCRNVMVSFVLCPSHSLRPQHHNTIWCTIQITELLITQFPPSSCVFFLFLSSDILFKIACSQTVFRHQDESPHIYSPLKKKKKKKSGQGKN